ncbi:hypothetical protein ACLKA7_005281 [Drosophila subpalustris]
MPDTCGIGQGPFLAPLFLHYNILIAKTLELQDALVPAIQSWLQLHSSNRFIGFRVAMLHDADKTRRVTFGGQLVVDPLAFRSGVKMFNDNTVAAFPTQLVRMQLRIVIMQFGRNFVVNLH